MQIFLYRYSRIYFDYEFDDFYDEKDAKLSFFCYRYPNIIILCVRGDKRHPSLQRVWVISAYQCGAIRIPLHFMLMTRCRAMRLFA